MKHVRAIVIASFVCVLGFSIEAGRSAGAISWSGRMVGPSAVMHANGMHMQRLRLAGRDLSYGWTHSPSIGPVATALLHLPSSRRSALCAMDAACGRSASGAFSARAPPAVWRGELGLELAETQDKLEALRDKAASIGS